MWGWWRALLQLWAGDVMSISKLPSFLSAILQSCCVWQGLMGLERDAVVAGPGQVAAGLEVTGWLCQLFDSPAQHPAIRVPQSTSLCLEL